MKTNVRFNYFRGKLLISLWWTNHLRHTFAVGWIILVFQRLNCCVQHDLVLFQVLHIVEKRLPQLFIRGGRGKLTLLAQIVGNLLLAQRKLQGVVGRGCYNQGALQRQNKQRVADDVHDGLLTAD